MSGRWSGKWILPQPENIIKDEEFVSIPRIARTVPFGYEEDPNDSDMLNPIPRELRALEKAKDYIKQYSYREVSNWLTTQTGRSISHVGLKKRIESEQSNRRRAATLREWARRYQKAIEEAEKIEKTRIGARAEPEDYSDIAIDSSENEPA